MPSIHELKKSLGLVPGELLGRGDYIVRDVEATMDEKKPRELYNFKVHVWMEPAAEAGAHDLRRKRFSDNALEGAKAALMDVAKEREIMYSSYGSPYQVHLEHVKASPPRHQEKQQQPDTSTGGWIEVEALCVAKRRRDLPRLSEQHGATSTDEEEAADDEMKRQGYRVVKAHFKSSHCPICNQEFSPGEHIAKPAGDKGRGGWAHTICLANQQGEEEAGGN